MRRLWVGIAVLVVLAGCTRVGASEPVEAGSGSAAAGPPWYSVAGDAPTVSGATLITAGPLAPLDGPDEVGKFQRTWNYTGSVESAEIAINRGDPGGAKRYGIRFDEKITPMAGHLFVPLSGIADGGVAVVSREHIGTHDPLVRAEAYSGNATFNVLMPVTGVVATEADLSAHSAELIAALNEVFDDLRP